MLQSQPELVWADGVNNWPAVNEGIKSPQWYNKQQGELKGSSFADAVNRMFAPGYFASWEKFASTAHNSTKDVSNTNFMSLEYIHHVIHVSNSLR